MELFFIIIGAVVGYIVALCLQASSDSKLHPKQSYLPYYHDPDETIEKFQQESEDFKMERAICQEASARLYMWIDGNLRVVIFNPFMRSYTIYHEPTAKYLHADIGKLVTEKYLELKKQYEEL